MVSTPYILTAGASGIASHLLFFIRGEHHLHVSLLIRVFAFAILTVFSLLWYNLDGGIYLTVINTFQLIIAYNGALFSSIVIYRLAFHRTRHYPGPFWARVSKFHHFVHARQSKQHHYIHDLKARYGDFVRSGPNEITIYDPSAIPIIHGPASRCIKAPWYDNLVPLKSIITTREKTEHDVRRRMWDHGYSVKALRAHESTIIQNARTLAEQLEMRSGQILNATKWFEYYGFDVMGEVQYSKSFGMMKAGNDHWRETVFWGGTSILGTMSSVPWLIRTALCLPYAGSGFATYSAWMNETILDRIKRGEESELHDTMQGILEHAKSNSSIEMDWPWIKGDMCTMITGGSEPVIVVIVYLFYYLATNPAYVSILRKEINTLESFSDNAELQKLPFLNALIYEVLRLHPSVPTGGLRVTPSEGLKIGDKYIPGGTTVLTPQYSIHRREDCFEKAESFVPERWTTKPEMVKNALAFNPWGYGPYSCIGKVLGLMEIRIVTIVLLNRFAIRLAPDEDGSELHRDTLDCFAAIPGRLRLIFDLYK